MKRAKVAILGVPIDLGAETLGVDSAPNVLRFGKLSEKLTDCGFDVRDYGNIPTVEKYGLLVGDKNLKYLSEIVSISTKAAQVSEPIIKRGEKLVILGGDHTAMLGPVSAASSVLKGELGLIYFDVHGDINTDKTTLTGNIHGMHLAALLGFGHKKLTDIHSPQVKIAKDNLFHIGGMDFDPLEVKLVKEENLQFFSMEDYIIKGMQALLGLIDALSKKVPNIWVSIDLDAIDKVYAPGGAFQNASGFTHREIAFLASYIGRSANVIGLDIVEYNPLHDVDGKTAELCIELISKLLGGNYNWYTDYMVHNRIKK